MTANARFWRNVGVIALAHVAAFVAFVRWSARPVDGAAPAVVWMNVAQSDASAASAQKRSSAAPEPSVAPEEREDENDAPVASRSEIELPSATPRPRATVIAQRPIAKPATAVVKKAEPLPRPATRKTIANTTLKPQRRKPEPLSDADDHDSDDDSTSGGGAARSGGGAGAANGSWYSSMLHDRFHSAWEQPTSVVGTKTRMSVLVKLRIQKDGRVADFKIVRPSGNVVLDESVAAVAGKVTRVDPLPGGVGNGEFYDVKINFELNAEE